MSKLKSDIYKYKALQIQLFKLKVNFFNKWGY